VKRRIFNPQVLFFRSLDTKLGCTIICYSNTNWLNWLKRRSVGFSNLVLKGSKVGMMLANFNIYKRYKNTQKKILELQEINQILLSRYETLEKTNNKNELLLDEIHHRIKNNLQFVSSLLNMRMRLSNNLETKQALHESAVRLHSMLLVHQKLYSENHYGFIEMAHYTNDLVHYLLQSYITIQHSIIPHIQVGTIKFNTDTVIPFGLLLTELITNSVKYAKPKNKKLLLNIELSSLQNGQYCLHYSDNGKGLTSPIDFENANTMGLRLLYNLTKQLKGTIHYEFKENSIFKINFRSI